MSNAEKDDSLRVACPQCAHRLKASVAHIGKKLTCPHCGQSFKVPGEAKTLSDDDDWLSLDDATKSQSKVLDNPPNKLVAKHAGPSAPPSVFDSVDVAKIASDERKRSQNRKSSIPSKPPAAKVPKVPTATRPSATVTKPLHARLPHEKSAQEYLERARAELVEEDGKDDQFDTEFDTQAWLRRTFGFMQDPGVITVAIVTGLVWGAALLVSSFFAASGGGAYFAVIVLFGASVPILAATIANGLAILQTAANQLKRVEEWPVLNITEWLGESLMVFVAVLLAGCPGCVLAMFVSALNGHALLGGGLLLISIWLLLPPILLSMLDNQSVFQPFSPEVFQTFRSHTETWGGLYITTGVASAGMFIVFLTLYLGGAVGLGLFGLIAPWFIFFNFNQIGAQIATMDMSKPRNVKSTVAK